MRNVRKYVIFGLTCTFIIIGPALSPPAYGKNLNRLAADALKIKPKLAPSKIFSKRKETKPFTLPALNNKISGRLKNLLSKGGKEKIRVIFSMREVDVDLDAVKSRGGKILKKRRNLLAVEVPADKIEDIVDNVDGIEYVRFPHKFFPHDVTSEGVNLTGADSLHSAGITGGGAKVAVIDVGFKGLSAAQANGDIPTDVITHDYTGNGLQTEHEHGTACAEIIYDMAPDAELHLLKITGELDFYNAIDYCINNGIDIINFSLGVYGSGPGDGTGPICEACDEARANGILFVASAGNSANSKDEVGDPYGTHWKGTFQDSGRNFLGSNDIHQFIPGDAESYYNTILAIPVKNDGGESASDEITVIMRWDDWPNANVDYDIYLVEYFTDDIVSYSDTIQNGSQPPLEWIVLDVPDSVEAVVYRLLVTKKSGEPTGKELELFLGGTAIFVRIDISALPNVVILPPIATSPSSVCEPADAESVLAVGAIDYNNWATGPQEDFSSQGPTNAWAGSSARVKPDICGPDGVSGYTYGTSSFYGTSASTSHVTGAAALISSMYPHFGPDDLQATIESAAIDMGASGKDNLYGWGRLRLNMPLLNLPPVLEWTGEAGYVNDGLEPEVGNSSTSFTFRITYRDLDGDAPAIHKLYIDKNGDGDYSDPGEIVDMIASGSNYASGVIYSYATTIPHSSGSHNCSYYFRFSDGTGFATGNITQAISAGTAINKPDIFQTLSLTIDRTNWQLSGIVAGSEHITDDSNKIRVTNNGDGYQTYSLQITNEGEDWSTSPDKDGADINKFVLSGLFTGDSETGVDATYFNETGHEDVIWVNFALKAGIYRFGSERMSQYGFLVPSGEVRNLWLEFKAPTKDTTLTTQSIEMTISAEVP